MEKYKSVCEKEMDGGRHLFFLFVCKQDINCFCTHLHTVHTGSGECCLEPGGCQEYVVHSPDEWSNELQTAAGVLMMIIKPVWVLQRGRVFSPQLERTMLVWAAFKLCLFGQETVWEVESGPELQLSLFSSHLKEKREKTLAVFLSPDDLLTQWIFDLCNELIADAEDFSMWGGKCCMSIKIFLDVKIHSKKKFQSVLHVIPGKQNPPPRRLNLWRLFNRGQSLLEVLWCWSLGEPACWLFLDSLIPDYKFFSDLLKFLRYLNISVMFQLVSGNGRRWDVTKQPWHFRRNKMKYKLTTTLLGLISDPVGPKRHVTPLFPSHSLTFLSLFSTLFSFH